MFSQYEIRELPLSLKSCRNKVADFLRRQDLTMEDVDRYFGVFDSDDRMVGGGGLRGILIKEIALSEECRGEALANSLLSRLLQEARQGGVDNPMLVTKPQYESLFSSLGFHTVSSASNAVLMESDRRGIVSYCDRLRRIAEPVIQRNPDARFGAAVMNCNPLTVGHRYLIEEASRRVEHLFIIPVEEDLSEFSTAERVAMLEAATADLENVTVCPGSRYIISSATFPTYFLKKKSDGSLAQMEIDLDLFRRHIAPALGATVRFVGTEPYSEITDAYNSAMRRLLSDGPLRVEVIERFCIDGTPVSATAVRRYLSDGMAGCAFSLVPSTTLPYLIAHAAARAMEFELSLTPKPGLVDRLDSGAHTDMDFDAMRRSIDALLPWFVVFAKMGQRKSLPCHDEISSTGIKAEEAMLKATGGVNTHRGALFSLGLFTIAASYVYSNRRAESPCEFVELMRNAVAEMASGFRSAEGSHGSEVCRRYGIKGAADLAREGYASVFDAVFGTDSDFSTPMGEEDGLRLLLRIMSELDDTNVYYRGGADGAAYVRSTAADLLSDFSRDRLAEANREFISRNLSPGGAADMLSLCHFVRSVATSQTSRSSHKTHLSSHRENQIIP